MIAPIADSDPDPTTQIPWPTGRPRQASDLDEVVKPATPSDDSVARSAPEIVPKKPESGRRRLTTWDLITLSISMAGAQIAWTVELGYGTPFLLSLGLSEHITSLVWLAGPISGLIAQPVIGALSDSSTSKYRRRYWIILSTIALVVSTITLAYCEPLAKVIVDILGIGAGDWDDEQKKRVSIAYELTPQTLTFAIKTNHIAIGFAVVSFYILDFALNGLQASLRNLLLDVAPAGQLNAGNAWHGRMTNAGNIIGFGFGFLPLAKLPIIELLGGTQFRKFCVICIVILVVTVWITCYCHEEQERQESYKKKNSKLKDVLFGIHYAIVTLPKPVQRVCYVQLFAFMGWFPFLFYSTTYMGQVMAYELNREPDADYATRVGEFAMLLYSIVGVITGFLLPHLASRDRRLLAHKEDVDEDAELARLQQTVREWRVEAARRGKPLRLPIMPFLLRNIWTGALLLFSILTFSTFFITTVVQATIFISLVGICWAVAMWVPFAIIMEARSAPPPNAALASRRPSHVRVVSTPPLYRRPPDERQPLLRSRSHDGLDTGVQVGPSAPMAGGTVLGIHNLAIVMPQFIVALVTSLIFRIADGGSPEGLLLDNDYKYYGKTGVGWVLRFGGCCTLIAALIVRRVPPTPTEKAMRRRLGEMHLLRGEAYP
ncbi:General alpha-glucoside permease [Termitomyces sp. J132]|nr:General alpha-glucoside permease [Termitomyces sp. J132]